MLAISGNTVAVGAVGEASGFSGVGPNESDNSAPRSGAVYIFTRNDENVWTQQAYIKASNTGAQDEFGRVLALDENTLVVGAPLEGSDAVGVGESSGNNNRPTSGAVYVFRRTGTNWSQEAFIKASNPDEQDVFGASVAVSGETIVVGARNERSGSAGVGGNQQDNTVVSAGAAYVFKRTGNNWNQQAYLKASNPQSGAQFGSTVAISNETIAVAAIGEDSNATGVGGDQNNRDAASSGAVYTFERNGLLWNQRTYLKASNTEEMDFFGSALSIHEDDLAVGARGEDSASSGIDGFQGDNSAEKAGAVYLFRREAGAWGQVAYVKSSRINANDVFGITVEISGNLLVVGSGGEASGSSGLGGNEDDNSLPFSGAAFVFSRKGSFWSQGLFVKASNPDGDLDPTHFGDGFSRVALSGDTLVVGAPGEASSATGIGGDQQDNTAFRTGAVYVFR